jgi:hypothetical protein
MARRYCTGCGTKLPGRLGHGMPAKGGRLVCGRPEVQRTVMKDGYPSLVTVKTPKCVA